MTDIVLILVLVCVLELFALLGAPVARKMGKNLTLDRDIPFVHLTDLSQIEHELAEARFLTRLQAMALDRMSDRGKALAAFAEDGDFVCEHWLDGFCVDLAEVLKTGTGFHCRVGVWIADANQSGWLVQAGQASLDSLGSEWTRLSAASVAGIAWRVRKEQYEPDVENPKIWTEGDNPPPLRSYLAVPLGERRNPRRNPWGVLTVEVDEIRPFTDEDPDPFRDIIRRFADLATGGARLGGLF